MITSLNRESVKYNLGKQFWIAMYNRGFEGWSVYRMFDGAITFNLPADTENPIPTRFTYPVNEQTLNETNYDAASSAIGGDTRYQHFSHLLDYGINRLDTKSNPPLWRVFLCSYFIFSLI